MPSRFEGEIFARPPEGKIFHPVKMKILHSA